MVVPCHQVLALEQHCQEIPYTSGRGRINTHTLLQPDTRTARFPVPDATPRAILPTPCAMLNTSKYSLPGEQLVLMAATDRSRGMPIANASNNKPPGKARERAK